MPSVTGTVKEAGEKNGAPFVVIQKNQPDAEGKTAKIWASRDYKGIVPEQGQSGTATFRTEPLGDYQVKKFEGWEPAPESSTPPAHSLNGSQPPQFVGRTPGENDYWTASRWAISSAIDVLGPAKSVEEYEAVGRAFIAASLELADKTKADAADVRSKSQAGV